MIARDDERRCGHGRKVGMHEWKCLSGTLGQIRSPAAWNRQQHTRFDASVRPADYRAVIRVRVGRAKQRAGGLPSPRMSSNGDTVAIDPAADDRRLGFEAIQPVENGQQILLAESPDLRAAGIVCCEDKGPRIQMGRLDDHKAMPAQ
jgi:hypothetical protein